MSISLIEEKSQWRAVLFLYFLSFCFGLFAFSFAGFSGIFVTVALVLTILVIFHWMEKSGFLKFR